MKNLGSVLLSSRNHPKYFYQCNHDDKIFLDSKHILKVSFQPSRKKIFCIFTTSYFACPAQDSPLKTYWENEKKISLLGQVSKMLLLTFLPILFTTFMYLPKRKMNTFFFTALIQNPCIDLFLVRMLRLVSKSLILQQKILTEHMQ